MDECCAERIRLCLEVSGRCRECVVAVFPVKGDADQFAPACGAADSIYAVEPDLNRGRPGDRSRPGDQTIEIGGPDGLDQLWLGKQAEKLVAEVGSCLADEFLK